MSVHDDKHFNLSPNFNAVHISFIVNFLGDITRSKIWFSYLYACAICLVNSFQPNPRAPSNPSKKNTQLSWYQKIRDRLLLC